MKEDSRKKIIYDTNDLEIISKYELACEWCVYNRMFTEETTECDEITDEDQGILDLYTHYLMNKFIGSSG